MIVPEDCRSLIAEIIFIVEGISLDHKKIAFDRIKRKMLRNEIKRLHKNNFQSVNTNSETSSSNAMLSNYVSVSDFKPLEANYSSIKIIDYATHGIKKDINEGLAKKIQYTSTQLLNKSTFLQEWMIRQQSPDLKPEKYPLSDYANKKISTYNQEALSSVRRFTFSHFCKFNIKKKQGFFSINESDPLKYKKTSISTSLTFLKDSQQQIAIEAFDILLRAGGDAISKHNYLYEINQIVELMMAGSDTIREEIFLQIIKQVSSKKQIYLRILCAVCYCVKPSTRIYIPLLNYIYEQSTLYEYFPKHLLNYCFFHLIRNFDKERQATPCLFQLFCAFHATKIPITVSFPRQKVFFIESYTTVEELLDQIIQYYNLDSHIQYLLEVNGYLMEKGNLLDRLNFYCQIQDEDDFKWKDYENFQGLNALVVLKNVNDASFSPRCYTIMYNYCASQYARGMYALKSTQIVLIAAFKMISEMENNQQYYTFQFANLISKRKLRSLNQNEKNNYRKHILKNYYKMTHLTRIQARKSILEILAKNKGFNTHFFRSQVFIDDYDQLVAWVGLQKQRFLIVEPSTGRVMRTIPYSRIKEWGKSKSELCLRVDGVGQFHIECRQVQVMTSVFENYINYYTVLMNTVK